MFEDAMRGRVNSTCVLLEAMTLADTQEDRALLEQILLETSPPSHNDSAGVCLPLPYQCLFCILCVYSTRPLSEECCGHLSKQTATFPACSHVQIDKDPCHFLLLIFRYICAC